MKYKSVIITSVVVACVFCVLFYNQNSEFLEPPKSGDYALVIYVTKEADKSDVKQFAEKIRDFKGSYFNGNSSIKSENGKHLFLRVNRSIKDLPVSEAESILNKNIDNFHLGGFVEFAILSDSGSAGSTRSFDPSVFP